MSELTPQAAEIRLAQYGERAKTWSTATYDSGTEKALYEIALTLKAEVDRLRSELRITTGHRDYWHGEAMCATARIVELEQARMATPAAVPVPDETAGERTATGVEYGVRVPNSTWPADGVLLDGDTFDRKDQEERLARCSDCWPDAVLVQRTVRYSAWTEATS